MSGIMVGNEHNIRCLTRLDLNRLLTVLQERQYTLVGPTRRQSAIVYDQIDGADDLPAGWTAKQGPGHYRLERREDAAFFGHTPPANAWKRFLHPPEQTLFRIEKGPQGLQFTDTRRAGAQSLALIGVRACDLAAIAVQDNVLRDGPHPDATYRARRDHLFIVAAQCISAAETCFCSSVGTGPVPQAGFDILLSEIPDAANHRFLAESGSASGEAILGQLQLPLATDDDRGRLAKTIAQVTQSMQKTMNESAARRLQEVPESPQWDAIATRCLACTNCTMVCPTCFCTSTHEASDPSGQTASRERVWDSCFNEDFSYVHGGAVRQSVASRYRQWLTHKLSTWHDQFGESGCVGCGRCTTWCPVGIDIVAEVDAIAARHFDMLPEEGP